MAETEKTIWVSDTIDFENHFIGVGFPHLLPFPELIQLEAKEHNSKVLGSNIVFTEEERTLYDEQGDAEVAIWKDYRIFKLLATQPDKLWHFTMDPLPEEIIFTTRGGGIVMNAACAEVLQRFRLGRTRLVPLRVYDPGTGEVENDELYYFLNLCERRNFFIPEASDPCCKYIGYEIEGYRQYRTLSILQQRDKPAYAMREEALSCDVDLWHEAMLMGSICLSDDLKAALAEADLVEHWYVQDSMMIK